MIASSAQDAETAADLAIIHSEHPGTDPTLVALGEACRALHLIRVAVEMEQVPKLDPGML
jgi:hypothetical protein